MGVQLFNNVASIKVGYVIACVPISLSVSKISYKLTDTFE